MLRENAESFLAHWRVQPPLAGLVDSSLWPGTCFAAYRATFIRAFGAKDKYRDLSTALSICAALIRSLR